MSTSIILRQQPDPSFNYTGFIAAQGYTLTGDIAFQPDILSLTFTVSQTLTATQVTNFKLAYIGAVLGTVLQPYGQGTVAAANDLTLPVNAQILISGNTQINAIITSGWSSGNNATLIFSGTPTVKHNTAGGAGTAKLFLGGSVDFVAANNSILGITYDGTQWQEVSRKVA